MQSFIEKYADLKTLHEWNGFVSGSEKTTQSFLSTALTALRIVGNDDFAKLTASNDIDLEQIRHRKTIVYLQIPQQDLEVYGFLLNLFYSRFFSTCFKSNNTNALPVYCLLDEAGHTNIPSLATVITTIRKYKVSISLMLQSLSQLETAYGVAGARTIIEGGIGSKIFFGGCDFETCETLSKILGNITTSHFDKDGRTQNLIRPLMTAQEIRMMSDRQALYLFANRKPIILNTKPYYKSWKFNGYTQIKPCQTTPRTHKTPQFVQL